MRDIYLSALPFPAWDAVAMIVMMAFPEVVLWLPALMKWARRNLTVSGIRASDGSENYPRMAGVASISTLNVTGSMTTP